MFPLAVGMGNHERDWPGTGDAFGDSASDSGGECGIPTLARYHTPSGQAPLPDRLKRRQMRSNIAGTGILSFISSSLSYSFSSLFSSFLSSSKRQSSLSDSSSPGALFYSFDRGAVHFIILDSEMPSDPESEQGR